MSKQLEASHHYKAYKALGCLPFGAPKFDEIEAEEGESPEITIHFGEIYCRTEMPGVVGELCGVKFESRGALVNHIKKYHNHVKVQPAGTTGNPSMEKISAARVFFSALMVKHDEKVESRRSEQVPDIPAPPPERRARRPAESTARKILAKPSERVEPPVYKSSNKKKKQKKGEINWNACAKFVKDKGARVPCNSCRQRAAKDEEPVPKTCMWDEDCDSTEWFIWDESDEDVRDGAAA